MIKMEINAGLRFGNIYMSGLLAYVGQVALRSLDVNRFSLCYTNCWIFNYNNIVENTSIL